MFENNNGALSYSDNQWNVWKRENQKVSQEIWRMFNKSITLQEKQKNREENEKKFDKHKEVIKKYIQENWTFVLVSKNKNYYRALQQILKEVDIIGGTIYVTYEANRMDDTVKKALERYNKIMIFFEESMDDVNMVYKAENTKQIIPNECNLICLTDAPTENNIGLMQDMEVDNIIKKPFSRGSLIEKIATTISVGKETEEIEFLIKNNQLEEAEKELKNKFPEWVIDLKSCLLNADILKKRKKYELAEKYYFYAIKKSRNNLKALKKLKEFYEEIGEKNKKFEILKKIDDFSPFNYKRKMEIWKQLLEVDKLEEADDFFKKAESIVKKKVKDMHLDILLEIKDSFAKNNYKDKSFEYLKKAINAKQKKKKISSDDMWMFNEVWMVLTKKWEWEKAIKSYEYALMLDDTDPFLYYNIGKAYIKGKYFGKAIEFFNQALALDKTFLNNYSEVPMYIGYAYYKLTRYLKAKEYFEKALEINPKRKDVQEFLKKIW